MEEKFEVAKTKISVDAWRRLNEMAKKEHRTHYEILREIIENGIEDRHGMTGQ